jgi:pyridoxamine 5'-phosphate oxidase
MNKDDLDSVFADIWQRLVRGKADRHAAFHTPVVASVDADGAPQQRVMVLRKVDKDAATLRFHTDARSAKAAQLAENALISVIGYDAGAKIQIRVSGRGRVETDTALASESWASSPPSSRRCYLALTAPGSKNDAPTSGLPVHVEDRVPTLPETELGRANFAVLVVEIHHLEWLYLASDGHRRAEFVRVNDGWSAQWLVP